MFKQSINVLKLNNCSKRDTLKVKQWKKDFVIFPGLDEKKIMTLNRAWIPQWEMLEVYIYKNDHNISLIRHTTYWIVFWQAFWPKHHVKWLDVIWQCGREETDLTWTEMLPCKAVRKNIRCLMIGFKIDASQPFIRKCSKQCYGIFTYNVFLYLQFEVIVLIWTYIVACT